MDFLRKTYVLYAFDGIRLLSAKLDHPANGVGLRYEFLSGYVNGCLDFFNGHLFEAVKSKYLSGYSNGTFDRYYYDLKIIETYAADLLFSYLICVSLKRGNNIITENTDAVVFQNDMILPSKLIIRGKYNYNSVILDNEGCPSCAKLCDGHLIIEKISNVKFSI